MSGFSSEGDFYNHRPARHPFDGAQFIRTPQKRHQTVVPTTFMSVRLLGVCVISVVFLRLYSIYYCDEPGPSSSWQAIGIFPASHFAGTIKHPGIAFRLTVAQRYFEIELSILFQILKTNSRRAKFCNMGTGENSPLLRLQQDAKPVGNTWPLLERNPCPIFRRG